MKEDIKYRRGQRIIDCWNGQNEHFTFCDNIIFDYIEIHQKSKACFLRNRWKVRVYSRFKHEERITVERKWMGYDPSFARLTRTIMECKERRSWEIFPSLGTGVWVLINSQVGLNPRSSRAEIVPSRRVARKRSGLITFPSSVWFTRRNAAASYVFAQILAARAFPRAHSNLILLLAARAGAVYTSRRNERKIGLPHGIRDTTRLAPRAETNRYPHLLRKVLIKCEYNFHSRCSFRRKFERMGIEARGTEQTSKRVFLRASSIFNEKEFGDSHQMLK